MTAENGWKIKSSTAVVVDRRYRIDLSTPVVGLDSPNAQAFAASDNEAGGEDPDKQQFALICRSDLAQRHHIADKQLANEFEGVLQPHACGYVAIDGNVKPYLVLERPLGGRVMENHASGKGLVEPIVTDRILPKVIAALASFNQRVSSHRRLRPENLFYLDQACKEVVLGECFSEPPGYSQPTFMEPIERGMASPAGRGEGSIKDDLYALGVTAALLLQGKDPTANLSADEVWASKMSQGSFVALVGDIRISAPTDKLLRGLLCDDPEKRWSLEDAQNWVWGTGTRLTHTPVGARSARPLKIGSKDILYDRLAAQELGMGGDAVNEVIKSGKLLTWVREGLKDRDRAIRIKDLIEDATIAGEEAKSLLVTRICQCLDPLGPVRYGGQSIHRDGFGAAVAIAMQKDDLATQTVISDLFRSGFLNANASRRNPEGDFAGSQVNHRQMQQFVENGAPGFGLERCLYELNTATPCISPLIIEAGAVDLGGVLKALNEAVVKAGSNVEVLDRHVAAFVAARSTYAAKEIPKLAVEGADPAERRLAVLGLFAAIQDVSNCGPLPELASWMDGRMSPVLDLFKNRGRRERLKSEAKMAASLGDMVGMFRVLGSPQSRAEDLQGLKVAQKEYAGLSDRLARLEEGGDVRNPETRDQGYVVAKYIGIGAVVLSLWFIFAIGL